MDTCVDSSETGGDLVFEFRFFLREDGGGGTMSRSRCFFLRRVLSGVAGIVSSFLILTFFLLEV